MARILLAEDESHIVRVLSLWLGRHGHDVREAADGAIALKIMDEEPIDLIICDMNMPVVSGAQLVRAVREEKGLNLPIFMVTARCDQTQLAEEMKQYDVRIYPKPFVPSRLVAEIDKLLGAAIQ
ncbi:MAG: response regulator [Phycisphaerales bacterium]|nr:MAG: response regulator [Phycisphaerales bacterium]